MTLTIDDLIDCVQESNVFFIFALSIATAYLNRDSVSYLVRVISVALTLYVSVRSLRSWWRRRSLDIGEGSIEREWWSRQTAVVTGGEGGLGAAIVDKLQQAGCGKVVSVDLKIDDEVTEKTSIDRGQARQSKPARYQCDVSKSESVRQVAARIRTEIGEPTILISNAGVMVGKRVLDFSEGEFEHTLAVNTLATYYWVRALIPSMLKQGQGHIVATASIMGHVPVSQLTDYVASKHALVGFIESLRYELDKHYQAPGISTTLLVLGQLQTTLFARVRLSKLGHFIMPPAKPSVVADDVVRRLTRRAKATSPFHERHGYVYRARTARLMPLLAALPLPVRNFVQNISGVDEALQPPSLAATSRTWEN